MANVKQGFEGLLYYGAAGATATTLLQNCKDITLSQDVERGNTTVRGDSTTPPIETQDVTIRKMQIEFTMINDITDTSFAALNTAAGSGAGVALRLKDYASGKGPDADFTLSKSAPFPLNGEQAVTFTAVPSRAYGRSPTMWT